MAKVVVVLSSSPKDSQDVEKEAADLSRDPAGLFSVCPVLQRSLHRDHRGLGRDACVLQPRAGPLLPTVPDAGAPGALPHRLRGAHLQSAVPAPAPEAPTVGHGAAADDGCAPVSDEGRSAEGWARQRRHEGVHVRNTSWELDVQECTKRKQDQPFQSRHKYVFTGPPAHTIVCVADMVYVLAREQP